MGEQVRLQGLQSLLHLKSVNRVEDVGKDAGGQGQLWHHQRKSEREVHRLGPE